MALRVNVLTDLGRSLRPVMVVFAPWSNAPTRQPAFHPQQRGMILINAATGTESDPVLVDNVTGQRVDGHEYVFTAGPAASKPFRDRYTAPHHTLDGYRAGRSGFGAFLGRRHQCRRDQTGAGRRCAAELAVLSASGWRDAAIGRPVGYEGVIIGGLGR